MQHLKDPADLKAKLPVKENIRESQSVPGDILQTLVDNTFDLLALIDQDGKYLYVAESADQASKGKKESLLGYNPEDLIGKASFQFMHPDDLPPLMQYFEKLFIGHKKIQVPPYRFLDAHGKWRWMEAIVTNQLDHPEIGAIVVSCRDVSSQVETANRLKELQVHEALMKGEEKERSRIARDLHDSVASLIAAAKMQLNALAENVQDVKTKNEFLQSLELLDTAAVQVRNTSHNLMPELLQEHGLHKALQRFCRSMSNQKTTIVYACIGTSRRFSAGFELSLYRIAQELIGNIIKHAEADKGFVQLSFQENGLNLTIEDNGKGSNFQQPTQGTGVKSVQKRVKALNGKMELCSEIDKGTSIYLEFNR